MTTSASHHHTAGAPLTFTGVLRSEWIKLRTLRSTFWCYVLVVVLTIGLGALVSSALPTPKGTPTYEAQQNLWITASTLGAAFSQLVAAVLGALVITGEYGTGMIRSSFTAVPSRLPVIVAKTIVFGLTTFVVSLFALVVAALLALPILSGRGLSIDLGDGDAWLALVGGAGYLALIGVLALGIGLIVRSSAAGIATALGLVLIVPIILNIVSSITQAKWAANINVFLPSQAGSQLYAYPMKVATSTSGLIVLDWWQALLVLLGWCALALVVGSVLAKERDA